MWYVQKNLCPDGNSKLSTRHQGWTRITRTVCGSVNLNHRRPFQNHLPLMVFYTQYRQLVRSAPGGAVFSMRLMISCR